LRDYSGGNFYDYYFHAPDSLRWRRKKSAKIKKPPSLILGGKKKQEESERLKVAPNASKKLMTRLLTYINEMPRFYFKLPC